ncbi:MAG: NlpC/P60 family protein [Bradymonadia bacterium]|jgi:hypothetical protein
MSFIRKISIFCIFFLILFSLACNPKEAQKSDSLLTLDRGELELIEDNHEDKEDAENRLACARDKKAPHPLPGITKEALKLDYWLEQTGDALDDVSLTQNDIVAQNAIKLTPYNDLRHQLSEDELQWMIDRRVAPTMEKFKKGALRYENKETDLVFWENVSRDLRKVTAQASFRILLADTMIHCGPERVPYLTPNGEARFSRNNCSMAKAQEALELLFEYPEGLYFVRNDYSWGWIDKATPLSAPLSDSEKTQWLAQSARWFSPKAVELGENRFAKGSFLAGDDKLIHVATRNGVESFPAQGFIDTRRDLTRRRLLETLFLFNGDEYGWGGDRGNRDCSRLLLDAMKSFGLVLPRHSADQAVASSFYLDISGIDDLEEKLRILDEAHKQGIVFLHFPGHIMYYLGRDKNNEPTIFHAFSEYLEACHLEEPRVDTLVHVDTTTLSGLGLGEGTARRSFLERLSIISVFANNTGAALQDLAQYPDAGFAQDSALCSQKSDGLQFWYGPDEPQKDSLLRIVIMSSEGESVKNANISLLSPQNRVLKLEAKRVLGPPHYLYAEYKPEEEGTWRVLVGNQGECYMLRNVRVRKKQNVQSPQPKSGAWEVTKRWSEGYENLYSAFVRELFDYPSEEDLTWKSLHEILQVKERNILHNYLGQEEDAALKLAPDCADLPYLLRAYFAWKLGLPFGYRKCSRGKANKAPRCGALQNQADVQAKENPARSFTYFSNAFVINAVHSASARTLPQDEESDLYPIPLQKRWLRPGTVYADPYGHLFILALYRPQTLNEQGVLWAVDAQPDGTITRKRFWRGNFLFDPDTSSSGAGFKAFRPIVKAGEEYIALTNADIGKDTSFTPFSMQQYEITVPEFYDIMENIINPRPLDPESQLQSLLDSLLESAQKRVLSVQNGEDYIKKNGSTAMKMPSGYAVFETSGPWEDFATPSRDMRLLIAIDAVEDFPHSIKRKASHLRLSDESAHELSEQIGEKLLNKAKDMYFSYTRSDGQEQKLSLKDLLERKQQLEIAYHPADCIEFRWGAPSQSEEAKSCKRRASKAEQERVAQFRHWFSQRRRPPR